MRSVPPFHTVLVCAVAVLSDRQAPFTVPPLLAPKGCLSQRVQMPKASAHQVELVFPRTECANSCTKHMNLAVYQTQECAVIVTLTGWRPFLSQTMGVLDVDRLMDSGKDGDREGLWEGEVDRGTQGKTRR